MSSPKPSLDDLRIERSGKPDAPPRLLLLAVAGVLAVVIAAAFWWLTRPKAVEVHTVIAREAARTGGDRTVLNASGYVTARREATVSSKITGKVTEAITLFHPL